MSQNTDKSQIVLRTPQKLFSHVSETWNLDEVIDLQILLSAAKLHELGIGVAHTQ